MSVTEFGWPAWAGGAGGGFQGATFSSIAFDFLWWATGGGMVVGLHWRLWLGEGVREFDEFVVEELDLQDYSLRNFVIEENMWVGPGVRFYVH